MGISRRKSKLKIRESEKKKFIFTVDDKNESKKPKVKSGWKFVVEKRILGKIFVNPRTVSSQLSAK